MKILIFADGSLLPGRRCWDESFEGDDDVRIFEGTDKYLEEMAEVIEHSAHPTSTTTDLYKLHVVQTIREALGIAQRPAGPSYEEQRKGRSKTGRRTQRPPVSWI